MTHRSSAGSVKLPIPGVAPHLKCPLTDQLLNDPVLASDGYVYDRGALEHCLQHSTTVLSRKQPSVPLPTEYFTDRTTKDIVTEFVLRSFEELDEAQLSLVPMEGPVGIDEVRYGTYKGERISAREQPHRAMDIIMQEQKTWARFSYHPHILHALGYCTKKDGKTDHLYVVSETPAGVYGCLYDVLLGQCDVPVEDVSFAHKVTMMRQICCAMLTLALSNETHRDVAARNILLFAFDKCDASTTVVKLSEIGTAVRLYSHFRERTDCTRGSAHSAYGGKHCSPEVVVRGRFSEQSDVWAFGVTCLEILTLKPLAPGADVKTYTSKEHLKWIELNHAPPCPPECPSPLWTILKTCFEVNEPQRATFLELNEKLNTFTW